MTRRRVWLPIGIFAGLVFALCAPAQAQSGPTLQSATFFGGPADQRGTAIAIANGGIFVSGYVQSGQLPTDTALVIRYATPPASCQ